MWWRGQNLERPIWDSAGQRWHFRVWHDHIEGIYIQRIFFWNDTYEEMGMLELAGEQTLHIRQLKQRIIKLARDPSYRQRFHTAISFPLERYYL